jgi:hypothetical protein
MTEDDKIARRAGSGRSVSGSPGPAIELGDAVEPSSCLASRPPFRRRDGLETVFAQHPSRQNRKVHPVGRVRSWLRIDSREFNAADDAGPTINSCHCFFGFAQRADVRRFFAKDLAS